MAVLALAASLAAPADATTLRRMGVEELVAANQAIVVGQVSDVRSYWNKDRSFILTDVRIAVNDVLKGNVGDEVTVTLMGGRVGEVTTLILGGAELLPGKSYLLFLNEESLPGKRAQTVRDLCQGAYDLVIGKDGLRAVSQANRHPLIPDRLGYVDAPGGVEGFPFNAMLQSIRGLVRGGVN
ncbi:MAG TPA: hypothetical protein DD490_15790 [Acidobacteria bacterium]|nr:hypothetical protein [Acidobacteriota bacterium]